MNIEQGIPRDPETGGKFKMKGQCEGPFKMIAVLALLALGLGAVAQKRRKRRKLKI